MTDDSLLRNELEAADEANVVVQRLFLQAAQWTGSPSALGEHLGLPYAELRTYLRGEALPAEEVLLRTVDLVIEELQVLKKGFSEQAWRSLSVTGQKDKL